MTDEKRPREWVLQSPSHIKPWNVNQMEIISGPIIADRFVQVSVIEKSAFDAQAEEIERLKKIIAKELSENDELGAEFVYVNILKEEINKMATKYIDVVDKYNIAADKYLEASSLVASMKSINQKMNEDNEYLKKTSSFWKKETARLADLMYLRTLRDEKDKS